MQRLQLREVACDALDKGRKRQVHAQNEIEKSARENKSQVSALETVFSGPPHSRGVAQSRRLCTMHIEMDLIQVKRMSGGKGFLI